METELALSLIARNIAKYSGLQVRLAEVAR